MIDDIDILHVGLIISGLILLIWGSDRFVYGSSALARNFGVTPLLIGLTIVAFATSAPEILVSIISAIQKEPGIAYGNALGSNIINIGLILGLTAAIRPIPIEPTLNKKMQILLTISIVIALLFLDASISRLDGIIMLLSLIVTMFWFVKIETRFASENPVKIDSDSDCSKNISMKFTILWLSLGLLALLIGADLLVDGAIGVARTLNISEIIIGITIVALGTSLPELSISIVSAIKGEYGLAIGNIVGSNIYNLLAVIGAAAVIYPSDIDYRVLSFHFLIMIIFTIALFFMTYKFNNKTLLSRAKGALLVFGFTAYTVYVVI
ncbi:MAG: calcium/sodium antiporter [Woeseia sp.]|mgnify:CR=1 FL=1|nr:calcium/sodium antiporter [Woeseia sp.]|tara:strand:+ start:11509 stop:12477 length:969 start_codon:yes stop_codon:yes gene_type:complete